MSIEIKKSEKPVIYEDAKKIMEERLLNVDQNKSNELIWTLEHPDIYTAGTSYNENDILDKSIKILETNRGGKITYHGPGQLICYFVIDLKKRKKTPILVGGTGLYFKAIIEGLVNIPNIPIRLRSKIRLLHKKIGTKKFFLELIKLDPISKNFIKPSDTQRVIRAYEVKSFTKRSIYDWFKSTRSDYEKDDFFKIYIDYPRAELIKRIEDRTQDMVKNGAVSEVKKFIKLKVPKVKTASKAIGIAEIREYLKKKIEISEVIQKISIKTRQYAKRQSTWGRGNMMDWNKIKSEDLNKFLKKI